MKVYGHYGLTVCADGERERFGTSDILLAGRRKEAPTR
jgi:hypothetical protein